ncbi:SPOR domain-containing protein [uncultured Photobacterium sp.]|uniref:SPOR domain-containing protein n=1 Tax=uncultured Photobacterium sp. TaxID=173973 RepID=UPI002611F8D8|nr:SPOR domain-containing protein [uncultured Photobacterium sp.]
MASKFQSRLVGTIILVAIGVIFLPDLFDGKKQHYQEQFASIPLQPQIGSEEEFATIPEPEFAEIDLPPEPVSEPKVGNQDSGWVVQLGVFRNIDNANQLVVKLRDAGYQAHVFPKQPKKGDLARVVVGPDISKSKLSAQVKDLEKLTGLKGRLLRFNPLNP